MKTSVLRLFAVFAACIVSVSAGEIPRSRQLLRQAMGEYHFGVFKLDSKGKLFLRVYTKEVSPRIEFELPHLSMKSLEEHFNQRAEPNDRLTQGLLIIADNLGASDLTSDGVSWRDDDRVFGFRSLKKFSYQYKPRHFPRSLPKLLDEMFGEPFRAFVAKSFEF